MSAAIDAVRRSHERLRSLLAGLGDEEVRAPSYDDDWSIADVASHLGSQAEIFGAFLEAGIAGQEPPGFDSFPPIWDRWNAKVPTTQAGDSVAADAAFVERLESVPRDGAFRIAVFGTDQDLDGFALFRLREHAVHTWDIAAALDPAATVSPDAVDLLVDTLPGLAERAGKAVEAADSVVVGTSDSSRLFRVTLDPEVSVDPLSDGPAPADVTMPAEAFLRLVYGRLDPAHTPEGVQDAAGRLEDLRRAFPGF